LHIIIYVQLNNIHIKLLDTISRYQPREVEIYSNQHIFMKIHIYRSKGFANLYYYQGIIDELQIIDSKLFIAPNLEPTKSIFRIKHIHHRTQPFSYYQK